MRHIMIACAMCLLLTSALDAVARSKTDIVVLENGDNITCEIKELSRGKLQVKTDAMSTVYVEWFKIDSLQSGYYYRVKSSDGERYYGSLEMQAGSEELRVKSASALAVLPAVNVVEIVPLEQSFWQRNKGSLSVGFSYTKATDIAEITAKWNNNYRTERNLVNLKIDAALTENIDQSTRRAKAGLDFTRLLHREKWIGVISGSIERNDELGLAERLLASLLTGTNPLYSNVQILLLAAGVAVNSERATGTTGMTESMEITLTGSYSLFFYDTPEMKIDAKLDVYPSITEKGRYRINFDSSASREIIKDFFIDFSYYVNYDNKTASGEGAKQDYGITTSLGYSY